MECNKEEAMRAMQLAETKMQNKDFTGALKFAQKAQRLFPELDNISHLLAVCEIHCSAEKKLGVSETDWYGVLQIEQTVDEATIRKQYRKLALLLHPDKNKFAGAEAAFKLIGEANRVLTDHSKRSIYDMKYRGLMRTAVVNPSLHQSNGSTSVQKHYGTANNQHNIPHPQSTGWQSYQQTAQLTFWTCCPYCKIRFQYYRNCVNRVLSCHSCSQHFVAQDLGAQGVPPRSFQSQFANQKEAQNQGPPKVSSQNSKGNHSGTKFHDRFSNFHPASKAGSAADLSGGSKMEGKDKQHVDVGVGKKGVEMPKSSPAKSKEPEASKNANRKRRRKKVVESNESCETGNTNDTEDVTQENVVDSSTPYEGDNPRRSSRQKQNISYRENLSDDDNDFASPPKKPRESKSSSASDENMKKASVHGGVTKDDGLAAAASMDGHEKEVKYNLTVPVEESLPSKIKKTCESEVKGEEAVISDHLNQNCEANDGAEVKSNHMSDPQILTYPDPEFNDFDKDKAENCFAINQVWAIYDTFDGMPRFYARIKKVFSPGFKLLISWFEADPDDQSQIDWCDQDLPVACGKYRIGGTDETEDRLMFSHQMQCVKGRSRGAYMVYPRKGETWALYQNWDISWVSDPQKHVPYEFEYVEVLSDFVEDSGITVAYLSKVKGFVSLFQLSNQHGIMSFQVPPNDLYRFSHRIPSFKMTGDERQDVPRGSFELDPAALSNNLSMFGDHSDVKKDIGSMATEASGFCPNSLESDVKPVMGSERIPAAKKHDNKDLKRQTPISRSPGKPNSLNTNYGKIDANEAVAAASVKDIKRTNLTPTEESALPSQVDERVNTPRKQGKKNHGSESFELRRSPRDLSKKLSPENTGQFAPDLVTTMNSDSNKDESHGCTRFKVDTTSSCSGGMMQSSRKMHSKSPRKCPFTPSSASPVFIPSTVEGFDIDHPKSKEKFQLGQIWALYSDRDGFPKTYVQVKRIQSTPDFQLHVALLEPCSQPKNMSRPVSCGTFIVKDGETKVFPCSSFSHCLSAKHIGKNRYEINPQIGEVWALYKNQNPISACPNTGEAEFDIVEVLEDSGKSTQVVILSRVDGYKSMFKAPRIQRSKTGVIDIPRSEAARFSHKIPSYKHTGEKDSRLLGYWELDPLSIPGIIVCLD